MSRLFVGTRKGLFILGRGAAGWSVDSVHFIGDPVSLVLPDARDGAVYAALNLGHFGAKLHRSDDGGATFREVAAPAFAQDEPPDEGQDKGPSVEDLWALRPGGTDQPGRLWAGTIPGGLFRSDDRGDSWTLVRSLWDHPSRLKWFGGGRDRPGIHSVCVHPDDSRRVGVAISCGGAWQTDDDGVTWTNRSAGMYAEYMPPDRRDDPEIQDPHQMVRCPAAPDRLYVQHHNGVFGSRDGGLTWTELHPPVSKFGFAVAVHPVDPDVAWLVPAVEDSCRVPVDGHLVVTRTRDGGATWDELRAGLPQEHAYDIVYRHALVVDPTGDVLAFGSTTGSLWLSEDGGDGWQTVSANLPPVYSVAFG